MPITKVIARRSGPRRMVPAAFACAAILVAMLAGCDRESTDSPTATDARPDKEQTGDEEMVSRKYSGAELETEGAEEEPQDRDEQAVRSAAARLAPTEGNTAAGTVRFRLEGDNVLVSGTVTGLEPGPHGFHVHEIGDCSAPDGTSAGGHFNPDGDPHGAADSANDSHHVGDLGNITANEDGSASIDLSDSEMALGEGAHSVIGKAVIVHGGEDDLSTQPSGNAGPRVACGVIREEPAER